jgi:hypothetical protein
MILVPFVVLVSTQFAAETGMWIINHEDLEFLRDSSDGPVNIQKPLAAQTGLYFQPYCASLPMPAELLSRFVVRPFPSSQFLKHLCRLLADSSFWAQ